MADFNSEIVIIGAGVIGLAIARALSKRRQRSACFRRTSRIWSNY